MKRTADQAFAAEFGTSGQKFMPSDPKAYYAQWCKSMKMAASSGASACGSSSVMGDTMSVGLTSISADRDGLIATLEESSAHKCVELLRGKVDTINPVAAVAGLMVMATKSSIKLREELMKLATVKNLHNRVTKMIKDPNNFLYKQPLRTVIRACYAVGKMVGEKCEDKALFDVAIKKTTEQPLKMWSADELSQMLWAMAKAEVIAQDKHRAFVDKVVTEIISYSRVKEFSVQSIVDLCWAISKARYFEVHESPTVRQGHDDQELFEAIAKRVQDNKEDFTAVQAAELACHYGRIGIKLPDFMDALSQRIMAKQKDISDERLAATITVYRKFMLPLKDPAQGFRTMAVVVKGDFVRPSDKPKKKKQEFDKPVALFSTR